MVGHICLILEIDNNEDLSTELEKNLVGIVPSMMSCLSIFLKYPFLRPKIMELEVGRLAEFAMARNISSIGENCHTNFNKCL